MPPSLLRARHAAAILLLITIATAGCGAVAQDEGPTSRFEGELEAMAGVATARVEREAFDTDHWGEEIVVDLDHDATAEEVAAVLDAFVVRRGKAKGAPQDARVTIGAATTTSEGDRFAADSPPQAVPADGPAGNARIARLLVTAVAAFPGHFVSVTPSGWSVTGIDTGIDPRARLDRMIGVVRADDLLSTSEGLELTAVAGPRTDRRTISVDAHQGLTPGLVGSWRRLSAHLDARLLRALWLGPASIHLEVRAGESVRPRRLTVDTYGVALWPTLHAALDALVAMPGNATLTVVNRYDVAAVDGSYREDRFLMTRPRLRTARDRLGRTWNAEAAAYLDRARSSASKRP